MSKHKQSKQKPGAHLKRADIPASLVQAYADLQSRQFPAALSLLREILAVEAEHPLANKLLMMATVESGDIEQGLRLIAKALKREPMNAELLMFRGLALNAQQRFDEALAALDQAIAIRQDFAVAYYNRCMSLCGVGRYAEALASCGHALSLQSDYPLALYQKATLKLMLGDFAEGWALYEWRWKTQQLHSLRSHPRPPWLGDTPLAGKTILLHAEQGLGDTIQFCRYIPEVCALAGSVIVEAQPALLPLLSGMQASFRLLRTGDPLPPFDLHCPLMSLPHAFGTTLETVPGKAPYLFADAERAAVWRRRLGPRTRPRIGLVWSGSPSHRGDRQRSIALSRFAPLLRADIEWHALQKDIRPEDHPALAPARIQVHDEALKDFADAAALTAMMDLVISVDTSPAHLAGALGTPVWILLPYLPDFRWMLEREDSPWYPSAQLYRQPSPGNWDVVLERIGRELEGWLVNQGG